jgi:hypothetical protein
MKRFYFLLLASLAIYGCKKTKVPHTSVFGVGGSTGPALRSLYSLLPSNITPPTFPSFLDSIKYETAIFKILVDGQEDPNAEVLVGSTRLSYSSDKGLYMLVDSNGIPKPVELSAGTEISIRTNKYNESIKFSLPALNPPDSIAVDTGIRVGDSIRVSWSSVSGVDSIQVFFKLNDKDPYIKNLPPTATYYYIPSSYVSDTGTAFLMINALKYLKIQDAIPPSTMLLIKGKAYPLPIRVR